MTRTRQITRFSRFKELGNLELLHASYTCHTFAPHFHEGHVVGVIEKGELGFDYRGEKLVAVEGQINLADPGEVHNGFAVSDTGWAYRMFYFSPGQLEGILGEICEKKRGFPFFGKGVIHDPALARAILDLHRDLTCPGVSSLEKESRVYGLVRELVARHLKSPVLPPRGREKKGISQVRDYIQDRSSETVTLADLARAGRMSKFHLLRVFKAETGLTPHAYLNQVRAERVRQMMDQGLALARIALEAGFFDQSHMNRIFKRVYGITPGQYAGA